MPSTRSKKSRRTVSLRRSVNSISLSAASKKRGASHDLSARDEKRMTLSSGNVFADLGFEHPDEEFAKAELVRLIGGRIAAKKLSQRKVAVLLGMHQPDVSRLLNGVTTGYSIGKLTTLLTSLGADVEIQVRFAPRKTHGRLSVLAL
jgi:predicted XRE-type DNA-binding protein